MHKKSLIITILLVFAIILSSTAIFAQDTSDIAIDEKLSLDENSNVGEIIQSTEDEKLSASYDIANNSDSETIQKTINEMSRRRNIYRHLYIC